MASKKNTTNNSVTQTASNASKSLSGGLSGGIASSSSGGSNTGKTSNTPSYSHTTVNNKGQVSYGGGNMGSTHSPSSEFSIDISGAFPDIVRSMKQKENDEKNAEMNARALGPSVVRDQRDNGGEKARILPNVASIINAFSSIATKNKQGLHNVLSNNWGFSYGFGGGNQPGLFGFHTPIGSITGPVKSNVGDRQDNLISPTTFTVPDSDNTSTQSDSTEKLASQIGSGLTAGISALSNTPVGNYGNMGSSGIKYSAPVAPVTDSLNNAPAPNRGGSDPGSGFALNLGALGYKLGGENKRERDKASAYQELFEDLGKGSAYGSLMGNKAGQILGHRSLLGEPSEADKNKKKFLGG